MAEGTQPPSPEQDPGYELAMQAVTQMVLMMNRLVTQQPGTDLVPIRDSKQTLASVTGLDVFHPDDKLDAYDRGRVNRTFDIQLVFGRHGFGYTEDNYHHAVLQAPTQAEYQQMDAVIGDMEPGDVLLAEGIGHLYVTQERRRIVDPLAGMPKDARQLVDDQRRQDASTQAAEKRRRHMIELWAYGEKLATARGGIDIVTADVDRLYDYKLAQLFGRTSWQIVSGQDPAEGALRDMVHRDRERMARNTLKDVALSRLDTVQGSEGDRKPRLVLLFGRGHKESLTQLFDEMGLRYRAHDIISSSDQERAAEVGGAVMPLAVRDFTSGLQNVLEFVSGQLIGGVASDANAERHAKERHDRMRMLMDQKGLGRTALAGKPGGVRRGLSRKSTGALGQRPRLQGRGSTTQQTGAQ